MIFNAHELFTLIFCKLTLCSTFCLVFKKNIFFNKISYCKQNYLKCGLFYRNTKFFAKLNKKLTKRKTEFK